MGGGTTSSEPIGAVPEVWPVRRLGTSEADLLQSHPSLRAEDLANAWSFYRGHPEEIEQQIQENEAA